MQTIIRMARPEDAPALLAIYAPYVTDTAISFEYVVPTRAEFERRIKNTLERHPYLVAEQEGQILGYAYASPFKGRAAYDWSVETSIYIRRDCRGGGLGRELYTRLEELLLCQNIYILNACITSPNAASEGFHTSCGYHKVAHFDNIAYKNGWLDIIWMKKQLTELPECPPPMRPITAIGDVKPVTIKS